MPHFLDEFELSPLILDPSTAGYVIKYYIYILLLDSPARKIENKFKNSIVIGIEKQYLGLNLAPDPM
jgi:hypothetical protein